MVDIDPAVTDLAATNPRLVELNGGSLADPRVRVVNRDAFGFTAEDGRTYDVVLIDLVDPSNEKPAKLYSVEFYRRVEALLSEKGVMVTQATSSFFSPRAFSTVASTVAAGAARQPGPPVRGQCALVRGVGLRPVDQGAGPGPVPSPAERPEVPDHGGDALHRARPPRPDQPDGALHAPAPHDRAGLQRRHGPVALLLTARPPAASCRVPPGFVGPAGD